MHARMAVALALSYLDGFRAGEATTRAAEVEAFLEHLAGNGFIVRERREAERRRLKPSAAEVRSIDPREIRAMRDALGIGLVKLSKLSGVAPATISALEIGRSTPRAKTIEAVLDALGRVRAGLEGGGSPAIDDDPLHP